VIGLLREAEIDLEAQIRKRLGWIAERGYDSSDYTLKRLESNLKEVRLVMKDAYRAVGKELRTDLTDLAGVESKFIANSLKAGLEGAGIEMGVGLAEGPLLRAIVNKRPFQGGLLKDWVAKLERDQFTRVSGAVRQGLLQGESIDDIVRRIRGTKKANYKDGILEMSRRDAEAVARTAVSHVANAARDETFAENSDLVTAVIWEATLDARTCAICAPRDGKAYTLDHKPIGHSIPWESGPGRMHFNDRCTSVPQLASWEELGIDAKEVTGEQRQSLDGFEPSETTFEDWIKKQGTKVQNDVLGERRGALLREGKAQFKEFFNRKGNLLNLDQLREESKEIDSFLAQKDKAAADHARGFVRKKSSDGGGATEPVSVRQENFGQEFSVR
jgi:SPP1 gp7 family putative phage head morphogenesis protein